MFYLKCVHLFVHLTYSFVHPKREDVVVLQCRWRLFAVLYMNDAEMKDGAFYPAFYNTYVIYLEARFRTNASRPFVLQCCDCKSWPDTPFRVADRVRVAFLAGPATRVPQVCSPDETGNSFTELSSFDSRR